MYKADIQRYHLQIRVPLSSELERQKVEVRKLSNISIQLFTVRKYMKTHDQIRATLHKLNEAGLKHIEVARVKFTMEEAEVIRQVCTKLGMTIGSTQVKYKRLVKDFDNMVAVHQLWGCDYVGVSVLPMKYILQGERGIRNFAVLLNKLGERYRKHGLRLLYHHHHFEFARYGDMTGLEILMEETDPLYVNLMMDTYWTQVGGRNPVNQIHQFGDRIKVMHLRDYKVSLSKWKRDYVVSDCALGDGNLDVTAIIHAAESVGVDYLPIEQDTDIPFEEVTKSVQYLKTIIQM